MGHNIGTQSEDFPDLWSAECKGLLWRKRRLGHGQRALKHPVSTIPWDNYPLENVPTAEPEMDTGSLDR